jgi:7-carboxy-7-deazaguanine synthase
MYEAVQGEGTRTGTPTLFVRFAGCNMRCPLWPCDTPYAIDPAIWRKEAKKYTAHALAEEILSEHGTIDNICLTGGEPFMQNITELELLCNALMVAEKDVECFSNGSFRYPDWALAQIHFMMDWKLQGSGEAMTHVEDRIFNAMRLKETDAIKFVIASGLDLIEAEVKAEAIRETGSKAEFWIGAAWDKFDDRDLINFILQRQPTWKLNVQVHKHIYPPDMRGI